MESRKVLSSLCYFSIFFAGFIFPLVVLIASGDDSTKKHAKSALLSHLVPLITIPFLIFALLSDFARMETEVPVFTIVTVVLMVLVSIVVVIWNIIKGVKVLVAE